VDSIGQMRSRTQSSQCGVGQLVQPDDSSSSFPLFDNAETGAYGFGTGNSEILGRVIESPPYGVQELLYMDIKWSRSLFGEASEENNCVELLVRPRFRYFQRVEGPSDLWSSLGLMDLVFAHQFFDRFGECASALGDEHSYCSGCSFCDVFVL